MPLTVEQLEKIKYLLTEDQRAIAKIDQAFIIGTTDKQDLQMAKSVLVQTSGESIDLAEAVDNHIAELKSNWQTHVIEMLPEDCYIDNEPSCLTIIHKTSGLSLNIIEHNAHDFSLIAEINEIEVADDLLDPNDSISSNLETVLQYVRKFFVEKA